MGNITMRDYAELFASFDDNVMFVDVNDDGTFSIASINPAAERSFGLDCEKVRGKRKSELFPAELAARLENYDRACVDGGVAVHYEDVLEHPEGLRHYSVTHVPMKDEAGKVFRIAAISRDITERKTTQEALKESEARYQQVFEHSQEGLFLFDVSEEECFRMIEVNPAFERLVGIPRADMLGKCCEEILSGETAREIEEKFRRCLAVGTIFEEEIVLDGASGRCTCLTTLVPVRDEGGRILRISGLMRDVTDRQLYEQALLARAEQERRLSSFIDSAPGFFFTLLQSADGSIRMPFTSPGITDIVGLQPEDVALGVESLIARYHPDDVEYVQQNMAVSGQNLTPCHAEFRVLNRHKGERWVEARSMPHRDSEGNTFWHGFMHDITERKATESLLQKREAAFRSLAENSPDPIARYDRECRRQYVNRAMSELIRQASGALIGTPPTDCAILAPQDANRLMAAIRSVFADAQSTRLDLSAIYRDGSSHDYDVLLVPEFGFDEAVDTVLLLSRDITESKRAEADLAEREREFRSLAENLPNNISRWDTQGRYRYINSHHQRTLGLCNGEVLGKRIGEVFPDGRFSLAETTIAQVIATGEAALPIQMSVISKSGEIRFHEVNYVPEWDEAGKIAGVLGIGRDITERKRLEDALAKRERELRSLADNLPDNIVRWDPDGRYLFVNPVHERTLGRRACELIGTMLPESHDHVRAALKHVVAGKQAVHAVRQPVFVDGVEELHDVSLVPEFDAFGEVVSVLGLGRDMTERYRMQETLAKERAVLRTFFAAMPSLAWMKDTDGRYLACNPLFEQLYDAKEAAILGRSDFDFVDAEQAACFRQKDKEVEASGKTCVIEEWVTFASDGRRAMMKTVKSPVTDASGKVIGIIGVAHDITESKRAEAELAAREREFRSLAERLGAMAEAAPGFLFTIRVDADGHTHFPYASGGVEQMFGLRSEDICDDADVLRARYHPDDLQRLRQLMTETQRTLAPFRIEIRIRNAEEKWQWIEIRSTPQRQADGGTEWHGMMLNITERKNTERELQILRHAIEHSSDGLFIKDEQHRIAMVNEAACRSLGYSREELNGMLPQQIDPDFAPESLDVGTVSPPGSTMRFESRHRAKDGRIFPVEISWAQFAVEGVNYIVALSRDITERKKAEEERRRFVEMLEESVDFVGFADMQGRVQYHNIAAKRMLGLPDDADMSGWNIADSHPAWAAKLISEIALPAVMEHGRWRGETALLNRDGHEIPVSQLIMLHRDAQGNPLYISTMAQDITERKRMEDAIATREREFRTLAENSPDIIIRYDRDCRRTYANPALLALAGSTLNEMIGETPQQASPLTDPKTYMAQLRKVMHSGTASTLELPARHANGEMAWHSGYFVPEFDADGNISGVLMVSRDITERKKMEMQLQKREAEFRSLAESSPDLIARFDRECRRLYANRAMAELAGQTTDALIGVPPTDGVILSPDDADKLMAGIRAVFACAESRRVGLSAVYSDGSTHEFDALLVPEFGPDAKVDTVLLLSRDITERSRMEKRLKNSLDALEEAQRIAHIGSWDVDILNDRLIWSDEIFRIWEIDKTQFEANFAAFLATVHPEDRERVQLAYNDAIRRRSLYEIEHRLLFPDGRVKYILERGEPQYDIEGKAMRFIGTSLDITERKKMESSLALREREMRSLTENLPDNIVRWDLDGRYLYINPVHERTLGISASSVIGRVISDLFPDTHTFVTAAIAQVAATGQAIQFVRQPVLVAGEMQIHDVSLIPERNSEGKIVSVLGIGRDMSGLYRLQDDLAASERQFRTLAENSPDPIYRYDGDCRRLYLNQAAADIVGRPADELIGSTPGEAAIVVSRQSEKLSAAIREVFASGEMQKFDIEFVDSSGIPRDYFMLLIPERDDEGNVATVLGIARDITDIRQAERKHRHFIANVPGCVYSFRKSPGGHYSFPFVSAGIEDIYGLKPEDVHEDMSALHAMAHPEDVRGIEACIDESARNMTPSHHEYRVQRPGFPVKWIEARAIPEMEPDGGIVWHGIMFDITERKRMETELDQSRTFLNGVLDGIFDPIFVKDRQHRWILINDAFCALIGKPREALIGKSDYDFFPKEQANVFWEKDELVFESGEVNLNEESITSTSGQTHFIQTKKTSYISGDGSRMLVGVIRDITERKRAEESLRRSMEEITSLNLYLEENAVRLEENARDLEDQAVELEAQTVELEASQAQLKQTEAWYRSILHSAPDGMVVVDERGLIMQTNAQLEAMFGYRDGELSGCPIEILLPQGCRDSHVQKRTGFIAANQTYRDVMQARTLTACRKDGTEFPVDVSLSRLPALGEQRGVICASVRDITQRHAMEAAREAALAEALRLAQLRSAFMAQMSHELRTPLNGILGYAQNLLYGDGVGEKQRAGLRIILHSGEHLLSLINGLLDHAAIEAGKFELVSGDIELDSFLSAIIGIIRVRAEQKNLSFRCDAQEGLPAVVRGDAQRLRQVLINLLANAVKFTDSGEVTLRVSMIAPFRICFEVQDSGVGISPEQFENIFLPFEQAGEISRRAGGTGLGLAISRKLVRLMGGDIKLDSRLGVGSVFSFDIEMNTAPSGSASIDAASLSALAATRLATPTSFAPPAHELDILYQLALRGSMREVMHHADNLLEHDQRYLDFVAQIRQLTRRFQTKALLALLEQYRKGN